MDQGNSSAQKCLTDVEGGVRVCELRLERRTVAPDGTERVEFVCGASGGPERGQVLGVAGEDLSSMVAICNACPIPEALASSRACLNLVPIRRFPGGKRSLPVVQTSGSPAQSHEQVDSYFVCRWFYTLYGQDQPRTMMMCRYCPHWFPRPPRELIPDYWPQTEKMLRVVNGEESTRQPPLGFAPAPRRPPARTWWQRLLEKVGI
jgi:hypothetical protein